VGDAEDGPARLIAETYNFPAVREDNLLHYGQAETGAFLVRGEIWLENFPAVFGRHAGTVIADFQNRFAGAAALDSDLILDAWLFETTRMAWFLHTHIAHADALKDGDWQDYVQVFYLRQKSGPQSPFGPPPGRGRPRICCRHPSGWSVADARNWPKRHGLLFSHQHPKPRPTGCNDPRNKLILLL